jgi:hypothetical protein
VPAVEPIGELPAETALAGQHLQHVVLEQPRERLGIQPVEGMKLSLPIPNAVAGQRVQMGMEVELVSVTLDGEDGSSSGCGVERLGLGVVLERPPSAARQLSQQPSIPPEGGPQDPGNGPHQLTVVDRFQDLCGHPLHEGRHALGLTGGTKVAGLAGKGEQILFVAVAAADASKAVAEDAALEKAFHRSLSGGADETRTRDLRRDRQAATAREIRANEGTATTY